MFILVCFDIVDNRVRYRVVKTLKGYGVRVQKSVFECSDMTEHKFLKLVAAMEKLIDHGEDTVRYYPLCAGCVKRVEYSGIGSDPLCEDFAVK
ncbi:CRISPR-associated protein Cas2 [Desulfamplus magnetovallimortis]|uniref:CRISPR-associated endoribonuclease Cas2 n=1 Tax=Desulfamplus magnetovallimortis TaxID=1246637 RepID=A0A1W1HF94_9BACT|nr:CRISPR-associated endonuclease Cas2 [Desulfamplus magnetovallimortis]SLM31159.1 CRISPR-associated protein Cas2 [Desulfamplus magnetovallimortis]